jgi:TRAP-type C4-dicarboxylate transport system substrate-binding protein
MNLCISRRRALQGLAAPLIIGLSSRAEAAVTLKISSSLANDPKFSIGRIWYNAFSERLNANASGQFALQFFPNNQLGQEADVMDQVQMGVTDIMLTAPSIWANVVPELGILDLGFIFTGFPEQTRALAGMASQRFDALVVERAKTRILGWAYNGGTRNFLTKRPFATPAELQGRKVRCAPNPTATETIRLMGAAATPMAWGEVYTGLQTGLLDGVEHDSPTLLISKLYENAKFLTMTGHIMSPWCPFMSELSFGKIPGPLRDAFLDAVAHALEVERAGALAMEASSIEEMKRQGVTVNTCDLAPFKERMRPEWDNFTQKYPAARDILAAILRAEA